MKNKKRSVVFLLAAAVVLLLAAVTANAEGGYYVNFDDSLLPRFSQGVYAVGSGGVDLLASDQVYALTAGGLELLDSSVAEGSGGLLYEGESVPIRSNTVRVGLYYYFSDYRDTSVGTAVLENLSGNGFSFGTYDEDGSFVEFASTQTSRIIVYPGEETGVQVAAADNWDHICGLDWTDKYCYLMVRPIDYEESPLISFDGNRYYGEFGFAILANSRLTVVNYVDIEHYVMGVCANEMAEGWPMEALKAQAVAARTYAQNSVRNSTYHYACGFDLTADTYSQVYFGDRGIGPTITQAVLSTTNQYVTYENRVIEAVFSSSDGGATEDGENVFGTVTPYLIGVNDPYEAAAAQENPFSEWKVTMTPTQLGNRVGLDAIYSVTPTKSDTGNVIKLEFLSVTGQTATIIRDRCRTALDLRNIRYDISRDAAGNFVFTGSGFGHNLGMSQWGAYAMAKYFQKDYRFILGFYYTDVGISYGSLE